MASSSLSARVKEDYLYFLTWEETRSFDLEVDMREFFVLEA